MIELMVLPSAAMSMRMREPLTAYTMSWLLPLEVIRIVIFPWKGSAAKQEQAITSSAQAEVMNFIPESLLTPAAGFKA
ncbi:MAG TPA: hypothetical protein PKX00_00590 [Opitutaceae bacterium]|nr:hypothetical protein [Opitutaceae bacterium]